MKGFSFLSFLRKIIFVKITWSKKKRFLHTTVGLFHVNSIPLWHTALTFRPACRSRENRLSDPSRGRVRTGCMQESLPSSKSYQISHLFPVSTISIGKFKRSKFLLRPELLYYYTGITSRSATVTFVCGPGPQSTSIRLHAARARAHTHSHTHTLLIRAFLLPIRCITNLPIMGPLCIPTKIFLELSWLPQCLLGAHLICFSFTAWRWNQGHLPAHDSALALAVAELNVCISNENLN